MLDGHPDFGVAGFDPLCSGPAGIRPSRGPPRSSRRCGRRHCRSCASGVPAACARRSAARGLCRCRGRDDRLRRRRRGPRCSPRSAPRRSGRARPRRTELDERGRPSRRREGRPAAGRRAPPLPGGRSRRGGSAPRRISRRARRWRRSPATWSDVAQQVCRRGRPLRRGEDDHRRLPEVDAVGADADPAQRLGSRATLPSRQAGWASGISTITVASERTTKPPR